MLRPHNERDILVAKFEIEHEDVFHLKNLYKKIHDWFIEEEFLDPDGFVDKFETLYWERIKPNGAHEHHIWWRTQKIPYANKYYRYVVRLDIQTLNMKPFEVLVNGQKMGTNKGDVILRMEAWLQLDFKNKWQNHWFLKHFDQMFRTRIIYKQIEAYKKDLYDASYRIQNKMKRWLELKTPYPMMRDFHPERGV